VRRRDARRPSEALVLACAGRGPPLQPQNADGFLELVLADGRRRSATQAASVLREQQGATRTEILVPRSRYGSGDAHDDCGYDERSNQVVTAGLHTLLLSVSSA